MSVGTKATSNQEAALVAHDEDRNATHGTMRGHDSLGGHVFLVRSLYSVAGL